MKVFDEIKQLTGNGFEFFSLFGYVIAALNISISLVLLTNLAFSLFMFLFFIFIIFILNFIFSSITSLYIDMQADTSLKARDIFYFYGISSYLSFLLIPASYFYIYKGRGIYLFFMVGFFVWLSRILFVKEKASLGFINSFIAVFFPHIIISVFVFLLIVSVSVCGFVYLYG